MKKRARVAKVLLGVALAVAVITGCGPTTKSYSVTYKVSTGDNVKITISDSYKMNTENPFTITTKDGEEVMKGTFLTMDEYNTYKDLLDAGEDGVTVLGDGQQNGMTYIAYKGESAENTEHDYLILVDNSQTGIILGSLSGKEKADKCFNDITVSLDK